MRTDKPHPDEPHEELAHFNGPYVDGELPMDTALLIEAHLLGCRTCRREMELQQAVSTRLAEISIPRAPGALRERIKSALAEPAVEARRLPVPAIGLAVRRRAVGWAQILERSTRRALPWLGWAVAAPLAVILFMGYEVPLSTPQIPMVEAVLSDYRRTVAHELPLTGPLDLATLQADLPFPVKPLDTPQARLIGAWRTEIRGEPTAALGYRMSNRVIIQYVVSEALFFKQPVMREAVARQGRYVTADGAQNIVAWPGMQSGFLLVGELPSAVLKTLALTLDGGKDSG